MRFFEMASAQEQLALWRLISDNTWAAVEQQAREEAARKAQEKSKAKVGKKAAALKITPKPAMLPPLTPPPTPTPALTKPVANVQQPTAGATSNALQPKVDPFKRPLNAGSSVKNGKEKSDVETDDRYSKNTRR